MVLPTVYMRLFIRSYTDFIGADSIKALEDFELHTTGTIKKRSDFDLKPIEDTGNLEEVKDGMESASQISPKQIATGAAVLIGLFLVLYWAGQITKQQSNETINKSASLKEKVPEARLNQNTELISTNITDSSNNFTGGKPPRIDQLMKASSETINNTQDKLPDVEITTISASLEKNTASLPNKFPLNTNDFLLEDIQRETTDIVKLFAPYTITITSLQETKLNISKSNDGKLTELINQVVSTNTEFQFDFESTINFEFLDNAHIKVKLNEIPLDNFLSDDGFSVRGSYEADKSQLYLGFYRN